MIPSLEDIRALAESAQAEAPAKKLITQDYCTLTPAYGRDSVFPAKQRENFLSGKDFRIQGIVHGELVDTYCSIRNFAPGTKVAIRFARGCAKIVVEVPSA